MFNKILIANRGDQPGSGAATRSNRRVREANGD
jgi:biotin carboxylase